MPLSLMLLVLVPEYILTENEKEEEEEEEKETEPQRHPDWERRKGAEDADLRGKTRVTFHFDHSTS